MNKNFKIIDLLWKSKVSGEEFISFYIIPVAKAQHFLDNENDILVSVDATEILCVAMSQYERNRSYYIQQAETFAENISSRFRLEPSKNEENYLLFSSTTPEPRTTPEPLTTTTSDYAEVAVAPSTNLTPVKAPRSRIPNEASLSPQKRVRLEFS